MSDYELERDAALEPEEEQALAAVLAAPELSAAEWETLHGRIAAAGELPLARRRGAARRNRALAVKWLRPALPLAAAAALLIVLFRPNAPEPAANGELTVAERALLADVSDAEFTRLVSGAADAEALLLIAAGEE